ncbi:hypothetical protein BANRA_02733 [Acinetobacter baumannii]|nr:hypothetical protein BANRA_02733 [Acinetobacter baumannii]
MNSKLHIMQGVDWSKYDLPEWLRQFGYWQGAVIRFGGSTENPLVGAIKKQNLDLRKGIGKRSLLIISVMKILSRSNLKPNVCLITDDEARPFSA